MISWLGVPPANRRQAFRAARQPAPILHAGIIVRSAFCADVAFIEERASTIPRAAELQKISRAQMRSFFSFSFQSASGKPCILSRKIKTLLEAGLKSFGGERGSTGVIPEGGASNDSTRANALVFFFRFSLPQASLAS